MSINNFNQLIHWLNRPQGPVHDPPLVVLAVVWWDQSVAWIIGEGCWGVLLGHRRCMIGAIGSVRLPDLPGLFRNAVFNRLLSSRIVTFHVLSSGRVCSQITHSNGVWTRPPGAKFFTERVLPNSIQLHDSRLLVLEWAPVPLGCGKFLPVRCKVMRGCRSKAW